MRLKIPFQLIFGHWHDHICEKFYVLFTNFSFTVYVKGSRNHKKAKRVLSRESRRISNKQDNDEWRIARSITAGIACLAIEDPKRLNFAAMRAKGGNRKKGMNRTMSYSRELIRN